VDLKGIHFNYLEVITENGLNYFLFLIIWKKLGLFDKLVLVSEIIFDRLQDLLLYEFFHILYLLFIGLSNTFVPFLEIDIDCWLEATF
jgi:hypothetical protein